MNIIPVGLAIKSYNCTKKLAGGLICLLISCNQTSVSENKRQDSNISKSRYISPQSTTQNFYQFDLPYLLNKNINQITQEMGRPREKDTNNLTDNELERRYTRSGYTVVITYNKQSGRVEGILLTSARKQIVPISHLLAAGNLQPNNQQYSVDTLQDAKGNFVSVVITNSQ